MKGHTILTTCLILFAINSSNASRLVNAKSNLEIFDTLSLKTVDVSSAELAELDKVGNCVVSAAGTTLSPLSDKSQTKLMKNYYLSNVQNMVLKVRLPKNQVWGLSEYSRAQYIFISHKDPLFMHEMNSDSIDMKEWELWKAKRFQNFVSLLAIDSRKYDRDSVFLVDTDISDKKKTNSGEDWPAWAKAGLMDEVILEGEWEQPENKKLLALAREELKGTKVKMSVALEARRDGRALDLLTQLLNLQGEAIHEIYVKVDDEADTARAQTFVKETLPEFEFGLGEKPAETQTPQ